MAGMPPSVVKRANEILAEMEKSQQGQSLHKPVDELGKHREGYQLSFFQLEDPVLKQIRDQIKLLDINNLTPVEALNRLNEIKRISGL
jgi:DNA mismatch repair protein MutS